jgi:hypothetical protein
MMITDIIFDIAVFAALVTVISGYLTKLTKVGGTWAQVQAWVVSIALGFVAGYFGISIYAGLSWVPTVVWGMFVGLIANGLFDLSIIKKFLVAIKAKVSA